MRFIDTKSVWLLALVAAFTVPGCSEVPLEVSELNPYVRRKWAEDEQYGPTFYARIEEIRAVRNGAASLTPQQQQSLANQLTAVLAHDENPLLRREAVRSLAALDTPTVAAGLQAAVQDSDPTVRVAACRAWGRRGGGEALTVLSGLVSGDQDLDVRLAATEELGRFRTPTAIQALGVALNDEDPALQYRAILSLKTASQRDYGNSVAAWREYLQGGDPQPQHPSLVERMRNWF